MQWTSVQNEVLVEVNIKITVFWDKIERFPQQETRKQQRNGVFFCGPRRMQTLQYKRSVFYVVRAENVIRDKVRA